MIVTPQNIFLNSKKQPRSVYYSHLTFKLTCQSSVFLLEASLNTNVNRWQFSHHFPQNNLTCHLEGGAKEYVTISIKHYENSELHCYLVIQVSKRQGVILPFSPQVSLLVNV